VERGADDLHMVQLMSLPPHHVLLPEGHMLFLIPNNVKVLKDVALFINTSFKPVDIAWQIAIHPQSLQTVNLKQHCNS